MISPLAIKCIFIFLLTLLLLVPLSFIQSTIEDRNSYKVQAKSEIYRSWSHRQNVVAGMIVIPYRYKKVTSVYDKEKKILANKEEIVTESFSINPKLLNINSNVSVEYRSRGIYSIPVYTAEIDISGSVDTSHLQKSANDIKNFISWGEAYLVVCLTDLRGIVSEPKLIWNDKEYSFDSSNNLDLSLSVIGQSIGPAISVRVGDIRKQTNNIHSFKIDLKMRGSELLSFTPIAKSTNVSINSSWPHPSFIGKYLPIERNITDEGFSAVWKLSSLATEIASQILSCRHNNCAPLLENNLGVEFIEPVDIYRQTIRSTKYGILIISIVFISFALFEVISKSRIHPLQYLLVGISLSLFFLILLSVSEFMSYAYAYLLATLSSVGLIGYYLAFILKNKKVGMSFSFALMILYATIYIIIQAEDFALLMGTILLFLVLSTVMVVTRKIDWYKMDLQLKSAKRT